MSSTVRKSLVVLFSLMFLTILAVTAWASLEENVMAGFEYLFARRWGIATLFDTYFGFLTIYLWIAYKERSWVSRIIWLVLILFFGTFAFAGYILNQLRKRPDGSIERLLLRD